jgi:membrane-associated phospholipid phosphatase
MRILLLTAALALLPAAAGAQPPDEPNAASRFLRDVAGDYAHFISVENAKLLILGRAAAGAAHAADEPVAQWVQTTQPSNWVGADTYGSQWTHIPVAIAWWAIGGLAGSEKNADAGRDLLRAQLSVVSWTYAVKIVSDRTRPNGDPHGFPSGHASTSFATAMVLEQHYGWKLGMPAFLLAGYTSASRVIANQHFMSDVIFGAAVGMAAGRTATLHLRTTRVSLAPLAVPGGGGVLVTATR